MTDKDAMDNIRTLHCGDYKCQLPDNELDNPDFWCKSKNCEGCFRYLCYTALQERIAGQHPDHLVDANKMVCENQPLTLEELRKSSHSPLYIVYPNHMEGNGWIIVDGWDGDFDELCVAGGDSWYVGGYGDSWLAYRRKPEEENQ